MPCSADVTRLCLTIFAVFLALKISGQTVTIDSQTTTPLLIYGETERYVDSTGRLPISALGDRVFEPVESVNFRIPFSDHAIWFRFRVKNLESDRADWYLLWENSTIERVDFYVSPGDAAPGRAVYRASGGTLVDPKQRDYLGSNPYFSFKLPAGEEKTIYLRVKSQRGQRAKLVLYDAPTFFSEQLQHKVLAGFTSGLIALRLFYFLFLALFAVRERVFRIYWVMIVIRSLSYWGLQGDLGDFLTTNACLATLINFNTYHFAPLAMVLVVKALLPVRRFPPLVRYLLDGILLAVVLLSAAIVLDYRWQWLLASTYLVIFSQALVLLLYAVSVARRYPIDWYYSIPFLLGLVSYFFWQLSLVGILNAPWVHKVTTLFFVGEIFILGIFLGKIIRNYERSNLASQQELAYSQAQGAKLQELDTLKTNFFANISHEFRTPLTLLVGPLADFRQKYPHEKLIPAMQRNVRRLSALIDQILDLSKLEAGRLTPSLVRADVSEYLRPLFASFESIAQSRAVSFSHPPCLPEKVGYFDADKLEKIVTNLLSNAFKFTPENGLVSVRVEYPGDELVLVVQDSGIGIEAERLPHIFDRFYQAKSNATLGLEGTGIGLALVHELVEVLRGSIRVESAPGRGSTFTLRLPLGGPAGEGQDVREELPPQPPPPARPTTTTWRFAARCRPLCRPPTPTRRCCCWWRTTPTCATTYARFSRENTRSWKLPTGKMAWRRLLRTFPIWSSAT